MFIDKLYQKCFKMFSSNFYLNNSLKLRFWFNQFDLGLVYYFYLVSNNRPGTIEHEFKDSLREKL